ncbi:hypothetical protein OG562_20095 [Streptomyces sp. NBC_01275]|uniref:hypothetical protein n=1 Tax=Streptomyces sp. NBC_01275 TaxID=2903807 RepID=UPI00224EEA43|nr:hypothetical protein [Streptomyces sp. NBC_01275]MCX4763232.1 hypothetical protein [Streptomyces sp. NBC_01275]
MKVPERAQKFVNVTFCLVAVAGIGWSGIDIWQYGYGRYQIDQACAGLVPAGRVLTLSAAGGTVSHRVADEGTIDLDDGLPQDCELFSTEAGEKYGTDSGERWFFTGAVGALPADKGLFPEEPWDDLLDPNGPYGDHTYPDQPLGGGIAGIVTDSGVTVELPCTDGESDGGPGEVNALWARASLMATGSPFTEDGQLTAHDRAVLAETAVITANRLAGRQGCAERLPDPPDDIPALTEGPTPAAEADADGTCGWYRKAGLASRTLFADQVLESRTDAKVWDERCALVLSEDRAYALWSAHAAELSKHGIDSPDRPGQYFASFHTYSGEEAKNIRLPDLDSDNSTSPLLAAPGEAGRDRDEPIWWASSVCAGQPEIHTMTLSSGYARLATADYEKVFRTYAEDAMKRRGCTDLTFPTHADFTDQT